MELIAVLSKKSGFVKDKVNFLLETTISAIYLMHFLRQWEKECWLHTYQELSVPHQNSSHLFRLPPS